MSEPETGPNAADPATDDAAEPSTARVRPEQTTDDTDVGWGETPDPEAARDEHERWLLEQRPPHWD